MISTVRLQKYESLARSLASIFSKDTSTQVGALIIGPAGETMPGYNGAPRGCAADEPGDRRSERPEKYFWFEHAERNAIYNAARRGLATEGCSMVVTHPPCMDCARGIVQAGIVSVAWPLPSPEFAERWAEHAGRVLRLFGEGGVEWTIL